MRQTRFCSLLLAFSMILSMAVVFTFPATAEEAVESTAPATAPAVKTDFSDVPANAWWDGSIDTEFEGDGTAENPYKISSAAELAGLAELTKVADTAYHSAHYELTADIYFNDPSAYLKKWNEEFGFTYNKKTGSAWTGERTDFATQHDKTDEDGNVIVRQFTPIALGSAFIGTFDGQGKTIYGCSIYEELTGNSAALIAQAGDNAVIKNVNMAYSVSQQLYAGYTYTSATILGTVQSGTSGRVQVENCHAVLCNVYGSSRVGGLVGGIVSNNRAVIVKNSSFYGNVYQHNQSLVSNCSQKSGIGGIVGGSGFSGAKIDIENCSTFGTVKAYGSKDNVGGITAAAYGQNTIVKVYNCANYANVSVVLEGNTANVGGIVGGGMGNSTGKDDGVFIVNCINYGDINANGGSAGGAMGKVAQAQKTRLGLYVSNFANYGKISGGYAGQVLGAYGTANATTNQCHLHIEKCVLEGAVEGTVTHGIVGIINAGTLVDDTVFSINNVYHNCDSQNLYDVSALTGTAKIDTESIKSIGNDVTAIAEALNRVTPEYNKGYVGPKWTLDARNIQAASLQLGDGIGVNLYAELNSLSFSGNSKVIVDGLKTLDNLGIVTRNDQNGVSKQYFHYRHNINPAEIGDTFTYTLNGKSIQYGVEAYATRKYDQGSENLKQLLYAILQYGDAARVNAGKEAQSLAKIGGTYSADDIAAAYGELTMAPAQTSNECITATSLNLNGRINLLMKVADGVTQVAVTYEYVDEAGEVCTANADTVDVVGDVAVFKGIAATALNLTYHLTALDANGEELGTTDWNVSQFITGGIANKFSENETTLAQALALYMKAARVYTGLDS